MWKVSLVGHSQLPPQLSVPDTEINIYRAPGGKATTFFSDERLNDVLTWTHDLCILWLGSNDIREDSVPQEIVNDLVEVVESIEESCGAIVKVCLVEPRFYPGEDYMTHETYKKVQRSINRKLQRRLSNDFLHFNSHSWINSLSGDGVHWDAEGKQLIRKGLGT